MTPLRSLLLATATAAVCSVLACNGGDDAAEAQSQEVNVEQGVKLVPVFGGKNQQFPQPIALTQAPGDSSRFYVALKGGVIVTVPTTSVFAADAPQAVALDISDHGQPTPGKVNATPSECGLLGIAFHPRFRENGFLYVSYTAHTDATGPDRSPADAQSRISRFTSKDGGKTFDPGSEKILLRLEQPFINHNGGNLAFGPDGMLYIGFGDGGAANDPGKRSQNNKVLFGKMLRIDVDKETGGKPYGIPRDNPFASDSSGRPEIWATGLRNPWRWSFDRVAKELWLGDVGQDAFEEIHKIEGLNTARTKGNYGWSVCEADHLLESLDQRCSGREFSKPIFEYATKGNRVSVIGGYVYRGQAIRSLQGAYLFSDFGTGEIFGLDPTKQPVVVKKLGDASTFVSSFGEDNAGELYVLDYRNGKILQIQKGTTAGGGGGQNDVDYRFLSRTGVASVDEALGYYNRIAPDLVPLVPNRAAPLSVAVSGFDPSRRFTKDPSEATTLDEWTRKNIGSLANANSAFYRNTMDLGFWREMTCSKKIERGKGGCRVRNWKNEEDLGGEKNLGTVAMSVSKEGFTQFFVFDPDGHLSPVAKLDGEGFKAAPRLCTPCHGGRSAGAASDGDLGSIFREFEPSLLEARAGVTKEKAEAEWFALNQSVKSANLALRSEREGGPVGVDHAREATNAYIDAMYPRDTPPALAVGAAAHVPRSFKTRIAGEPAGFEQVKKDLYTKVVAPYCMQCHRTNAIDFADYAIFSQVGPSAEGGGVPILERYLKLDPSKPTNLAVMPQAELSFERLKADREAADAITAWTRR